MDKAIIIGVGPDQGLGSQICQGFAKEGLHVFIASRNETNIKNLASKIERDGGKASAIKTDATDEKQVAKLFDEVGEGLKLAIYNPGNNTPGKIIDMETDYFVNSWKICCYGGFLFGREAIKRFLPNGGGTLLYTGASASLRGKANFGAFNSSKAALRALAQAISKEYGHEGVHVGHIIIDGAIAGEKFINKRPEIASKLGEEGMINLKGIVDGYVYMYNQPLNAWSFELDLRTSKENW